MTSVFPINLYFLSLSLSKYIRIFLTPIKSNFNYNTPNCIWKSVFFLLFFAAFVYRSFSWLCILCDVSLCHETCNIQISNYVKSFRCSTIPRRKWLVPAEITVVKYKAIQIRVPYGTFCNWYKIGVEYTQHGPEYSLALTPHPLQRLSFDCIWLQK